MKTIFVVCLVIYATLCEGQTTRSPCPEAGINQLTTCYAAYFRNYNFSSTPDYKTYTDTRFSIMLKGGVDTFKLMCQWHNTRLACIGSYDPVCATESAFAQALGVSSIDAAQYLSNYGLDNWECGPGYNDVVTNFYCTETLLSYHNDERLACNQAMNASIVQNGFSCSILRTFVQCYTKVYAKYCGQIGGYIGCNFAKSGSVELTPSCAPQLPNSHWRPVLLLATLKTGRHLDPRPRSSCEIFLSASTNRTALTGQCNDYDTSACAAKQAEGKCDLFTYNGSQQVNLTPDENSFILENCALTCKRCPRD